MIKIFQAKRCRELKKAKTVYGKLIEQDNRPAMNALGKYYERAGFYERAFLLYEKAALKDLAEAKWNLFRCYERGIGIDKSFTMAEFWLREAAKDGNKNAIITLNKYKKILKDKEDKTDI